MTCLCRTGRVPQVPVHPAHPGTHTIAAINGPAIGAGMCLALGCDMRLADPRARMGVTFVKLGLHPGMGSTDLLVSTGEHAICASFGRRTSQPERKKEPISISPASHLHLMWYATPETIPRHPRPFLGVGRQTDVFCRQNAKPLRTGNSHPQPPPNVWEHGQGGRSRSRAVHGRVIEGQRSQLADYFSLITEL